MCANGCVCVWLCGGNACVGACHCVCSLCLYAIVCQRICVCMYGCIMVCISACVIVFVAECVCNAPACLFVRVGWCDVWGFGRMYVCIGVVARVVVGMRWVSVCVSCLCCCICCVCLCMCVYVCEDVCVHAHACPSVWSTCVCAVKCLLGMCFVNVPNAYVGLALCVLLQCVCAQYVHDWYACCPHYACAVAWLIV